MQNLVKLQEDLKNLPLRAVMAYVEGRNPMVPPYLALTELNRRKQIQQSAQAQEPQAKPTIKDKIAQEAGLMALQNQRAQMGMQNMAERAAQVPQPGAVPENAPVQAASGGLMSARINPNMFNRANFAGGGIVAFQRGGEAEDEELSEEAKKELEKIRARSESVKSGLSELFSLRNWDPVQSSLRAYKQFVADPINRFTSEPATVQAEKFRGNLPYSYKATAEDMAKARNLEKQAQADKAVASAVSADSTVDEREANRFKSMADQNKQFQTDIARRNEPPAPAVAPRDGIATLKPTPSKDIYDQEIERIRKLNEAFGVKEQPTSESDKMIAELRKKIDQQRSGQGLEALGAAMARGAKGKAWYEAAAGFGEGYMEATEKQRKLNNEQDQAFANLQIAKEKEDDARRRGNVKLVQDAVKDRQKAEVDFMNAESNRIQALKPSQIKEQIELFKTDPETYAKLFPKENPLVTAAAKEYFENELQYKKQYPTVHDYLRAKGLSAGAGATASTGGPKEGDKAKSKSGKDIIFRNGRWEYA